MRRSDPEYTNVGVKGVYFYDTANMYRVRFCAYRSNGRYSVRKTKWVSTYNEAVEKRHAWELEHACLLP